MRNQLVWFDKELLEKYPGIYHANRNKAVKGTPDEPVSVVWGGGLGAETSETSVLTKQKKEKSG